MDGYTATEIAYKNGYEAGQRDALSSKTDDKKIYLYAARDTETGKLVSDLTNPRRKYWDMKGNAVAAINKANAYPHHRGRHAHVELVKFELVEVPVDD